MDEEANNVVEHLITTYKPRLYNDTYECLKERMIKFINTFKSTDEKYIDIIYTIERSYKREIYSDYITRDFMQYMGKFFSELVNMKVKDIKKRFSDPYDEVEERMYYRIELFKAGWTFEQIEKYICNYILKIEYDSSLYTEYIEIFFYNIMVKYEEYKNERKSKIGRPSLPQSLRNYINKKHLSKTKENMRGIYKNSELYLSLKSNLLTEDEYILITEKFKENISLVDKLKKLSLFP
jgi:hypothetical protein